MLFVSFCLKYRRSSILWFYFYRKSKNNNSTHLKVIGNFLFKSSADLKSSTISLQTTAGLSQSGFPGHQFLCFLDCNDPLGSRIKSKILTFKLQNENIMNGILNLGSLQIDLRSFIIKYSMLMMSFGFWCLKMFDMA